MLVFFNHNKIVFISVTVNFASQKALPGIGRCDRCGRVASRPGEARDKSRPVVFFRSSWNRSSRVGIEEVRRIALASTPCDNTTTCASFYVAALISGSVFAVLHNSISNLKRDLVVTTSLLKQGYHRLPLLFSDALAL